MAGVMFNSNPAVNTDPGFGLSARAYSIQYLKALYAKLGAWKHIRNFDADVSAFGESVSLPSFPRLTAVDVTSSTGAFAYDNTSITQQTVKINKMKAIAYSVPEYVLLQSKIDVKTAFAEEAARAVNDTLDHEMVKLIPSLTTNSAGSAGADLTDPYVLAAIQKLVDNYVPLNDPQDLVWILPSSQFAAVHTLKSYANSFRILAGDSDAEGVRDVKAAVDTLYGIDVFFRNDSEMTVSTGKIGGLFYRDSVGIAIQRMPSLRQPMPIPGTINTELLTHALFGIDLLKEFVACKVLCK